jgi:alpha-1,3-rhamnosyl/mannosyltransferase
MQRELPIALKRANIILTDSEFIRHEISTYFNWPLDKIVTAPLAASTDYHPRTSLETNPILAQWNLSFGQYSLFVGTLDPRKNINSLLTAYERMPQSIRQRTPLIITGFNGWKSEATLERIQKGEKEGWARYLGFVNQDDLPFLYAGARVFLYPSYYEGFGLPVLEAMASGIPVICSNQSSLPEVVGDPNNAALIHPEDHDALYNILLRALEDDLWCHTLQQRGLQRSTHFSWDKTASNTIAAYKLAYNS